MTRDDVMRLANKSAGQHWMDEAHIQRFAALDHSEDALRMVATAPQSPLVGTKTWFDGENFVTQNLHVSDVYKEDSK